MFNHKEQNNNVWPRHILIWQNDTAIEFQDFHGFRKWNVKNSYTLYFLRCSSIKYLPVSTLLSEEAIHVYNKQKPHALPVAKNAAHTQLWPACGTSYEPAVCSWCIYILVVQAPRFCLCRWHSGHAAESKFKMTLSQPGVLALTFSTQEAEAGGSLGVPGLPGFHNLSPSYFPTVYSLCL